MLRLMLPVLLPLAVWTAIAWGVEATRGIEFPTPWDTAVRLASLLAGADLSQQSVYRHVVDSLIRWIVAFGIAAVSGVTIGLAAGWWREIGELAAETLVSHGRTSSPAS